MRPDFIIVDVADFISYYGRHQYIRTLQPYITIHMLVSCALAFNQYTPTGDSFWHYFENKCESILEYIDLPVFEIFMETFTFDLDETIRRKVPYACDTGEYVLKEWVDGSMIILSHDESASLFKTEFEHNHTRQPIFRTPFNQFLYTSAVRV